MDTTATSAKLSGKARETDERAEAKGRKRKGGLQGGGKALTAIEILKEAPKPVKKVLRPEDTILGVTLSHEQRPRPC